MLSDLFKLNLSDLWKSVILFFITGFLGSLLAILQSGAWPTLAELGVIASAAGTATLAYLLKNLLTGTTGKILEK